MIEIKNLVKKYGNHVAVNDISFTVTPGKIYGFLGPNGAGKSTTMNMITGYIGNTSGSIVINGHDIFAEPEEAKRCIGYLPEIPPLYLDMTIEEYLEFVAELKKIPKIKRGNAIQQAMEMTKLEDVAQRMIKNLSKGYKQRVGLAQAVLGFPEIIILDEPTVGLDPMQIIEIRELIKELGKNHTVILSSHILSEIQEVCDYVFIISKGRLVASDTTENLLGMMSGNQEVELVVKGKKESIEKALLEVSTVERVEFREKSLSESAMMQSKKSNSTDGWKKVENFIEDDENAQEKSDSCRKEHLQNLDEKKKIEEIHLLVHAKKGCDVRELIFYKLAKEKLPILEMHTITKSLEDVFIELTQEGGK